jgi:hypothetical protein
VIERNLSKYPKKVYLTYYAGLDYHKVTADPTYSFGGDSFQGNPVEWVNEPTELLCSIWNVSSVDERFWIITGQLENYQEFRFKVPAKYILHQMKNSRMNDKLQFFDDFIFTKVKGEYLLTSLRWDGYAEAAMEFYTYKDQFDLTPGYLYKNKDLNLLYLGSGYSSSVIFECPLTCKIKDNQLVGSWSIKEFSDVEDVKIFYRGPRISKGHYWNWGFENFLPEHLLVLPKEKISKKDFQVEELNHALIGGSISVKDLLWSYLKEQKETLYNFLNYPAVFNFTEEEGFVEHRARYELSCIMKGEDALLEQ